ncbi:hypothetical protein [Paenibacillus dendritiformis]|uniref:hypothetical protein n=1 Tax=Paenibacillus dendritiformis TaxID=130049 RepID=UPI000DA72855|nr:hypothetical protein [Paenibacillus dendritiformis]PZM64672.1 hypothetical protein DOE73_15740 [Paenibacillus dendritiformis]
MKPKTKRSLKRITAVAWAVSLLAMAITGAVPVPGLSGTAEAKEQKSGKAAPSRASIQTDAAAFMKSAHGIDIAVERVIYGQQDNGRQVAAVFQLTNSSGKRVRIPDYELAVRMASGAEAAMEPSAGSPRFLMPGQTVEWRWMSRTLAEESAPVRFIWKKTDREVYPAKVTVLGGMPIRDVWENDYSPMTDPEMVKPWGQPFQLNGPAGTSMLIFTPVSIVKSSGKPEQTTERAREKLDTVHIVTLRVENRNNISEKIPEFTLTAWSDTAIYDGKRLGQAAPTVLKPGEAVQLRYAVETGANREITMLRVLMPETFQLPDASDPAQAVTYQVGRIQIAVPRQAEASVPPIDYKLRTPMKFSSGSDLFPKGLNMSIEEDTMLVNKEAGFTALLLRFKLENKSGSSIIPPPFHAELEGGDGTRYGGERIGTPAAEPKALIPNASIVESHLFILPEGETGKDLLLHLVDNREEKGYPVVMDTFRFSTTLDNTSDLIYDMYPFRIKIDNWDGQWIRDMNPMTQSESTYALKLKLSIDRARQVMAEASLSQIRLELTDHGGRMLGTKQFSLVDEPRLTDGEQYIYFEKIDMDSVRYPVMVNFYETLDTSYGPVKRFLGRVIRSN